MSKKKKGELSLASEQLEATHLTSIKERERKVSNDKPHLFEELEIIVILKSQPPLIYMRIHYPSFCNDKARKLTCTN